MTMSTDFGKRLKLARDHAGLSQEVLVAKVGIAQSTLATAEATGHGSRFTAQLAHYCGVDAYWLATGEGDMIRYGVAPESTAKVVALEQPTPWHLLQRMADLMAHVPQESRNELADTMAAWVRSGGNSRHMTALLDLLGSRDQQAKQAQQ